jgi:transcriptional regulator of acetoin/glycerol metabolism
MGETGFQTILPHIKAVLTGQRVEYENVSKAARLAGIDRNCLYRMMKKHGIARKE